MIKFDTDKFIQTTLGELVSKEKKSIISGPFGSNVGKKFFKEEGIPLIRGNNLSKGEEKFKDDGFVFLTREKADELNCYAIKNDLIFTAVGTIGQVGIIDEKLKYDEYVISNKQLRARFDNSKITPLFAYYWFSSYWVQKLILQRNIGSTVPLINLSVLKGLPITLPKSIETQRSIVKVLENISLKIKVNNKINQELEAMAKTLYDYWFVQFDFPDANGKPYKSSGGKMVFNEVLKREIPEYWEVEELESYADFKNGKGMKKELLSENGKYPVFGSNGIVGKTDKSLFNTPVIAIGRVGANYGEVHYSLDSCWITDNAVTSQPKNEEYLWWLLLTLKGINYSNIAGGSAQPLITQGKLKALNFAIPSSNLFDNFHNKINPIYLKINNVLKENQKLSSLRDWLLPMLMNGQVTVGGVVQELGMVAEENAKYDGL
ncbi:restriction endonuclease subunit S [uncultured Maribacter sp.]|uniref:restriction endonuclease subunit S n=1 Tax=uncultured Maribacter sp. TaxID=431308 RepID=UPI0030DBCF25|tara:strand:+ start:4491 stop:5789 length:1299 start_codon:yes stop_codon:yes gene_type:complete